MPKSIRFYGPDDLYFELANFYPAPIALDGAVWPTVEHYFQAQKTRLPFWKEMILEAATPSEAKKIAWEVPDYDDEWWLANREVVMEKAVRAKFEQHPDLLNALLSTKNAILIEESPHADTFWGVVYGVGENRMGTLLMKIRKELAT